MTENAIVILPSDPAYLDQLVALQREVYQLHPEDYNHPDVIGPEDYANHLRVFPEGQFMALDPFEDRVVGACSSMIIRHDVSQPLLKNWMQTTGYGSLDPHDPNGNWLYGVDNIVLADYRGRGIGGRMMMARFGVAKRYNLRGMIAGSMPIDFFRAAAEGVDIETYVADVIAGRRWDTNLSKQLKKGFEVLNVIPNYLQGDAQTKNYGVAIARYNPGYQAPARKRPRPQPTTRPGASPSAS